MTSGGKGASSGDFSLLFHIVKVVALVLFRSQDVAPPFNRPRMIGKLSLQRYRQLHLLSLDCILIIFSMGGLQVFTSADSANHRPRGT